MLLSTRKIHGCCRFKVPVKKAAGRTDANSLTPKHPNLPRSHCYPVPDTFQPGCDILWATFKADDTRVPRRSILCIADRAYAFQLIAYVILTLPSFGDRAYSIRGDFVWYWCPDNYLSCFVKHANQHNSQMTDCGNIKETRAIYLGGSVRFYILGVTERDGA
eukprot:633114-Prorocentrum_minimum.AAC.2